MSTARGIFQRLPSTSTTWAVSRAISTPPRTAIPTSACARAAESLTPSPTMATVLEALDELELLRGQDFREMAIDPQVAGDTACHLRSIAGQHRHLAHATRSERLDHARRLPAERIGIDEQPDQLAVDGDEDGR